MVDMPPKCEVSFEMFLTKLTYYVWGLTCNISETLHDTEDLYETAQALSVGEDTFDTAWPW